MAGDIFTLDADNNAAVRTVPVNAAASETNSPVIFTTDEDGNAAVRTVPVNAAASETNSPVIFTTDEDGNAAVRVVGAGGGRAPVIDELNVTPSTSAQTITAPSGTDGYSPVNVAAVTSAIDANIVAGNIKKDVSILGVTGSYEGVAPAHYIEKAVDANGKLINSSNIINLSGVTDVSEYVLMYAYRGVTFPANTNVDFSSLTKISGTAGCQSSFQNCLGITSVDLGSLTEISGEFSCNAMFSGCSNLTSVDLSSLTTLTGNGCCDTMFAKCSSLTSLSFPALTSLSFGTHLNQFRDIIKNVTGCTIHFPSNLDPQGGSTVISSLYGYPNFGGTNTVLAFDLPATE